ncbi:uncharacterized protein [Euwallacea similis]|uniref:uncharacterized protein n=1 Tax=Euwallacea similis TaxID=1736056 RepID=UPI00344E7F62
MTGVCERTVYRLLQERKNGSVAPLKKSTGRKTVEMDEDIKTLIRRKVYTFYFHKELPTLDKIVSVIMLIDKPEIISWRRTYLQDIRKYRNEGRNIFYLDETWLNEGHSVSKIWQDKNILSSHQAVSENLSIGLNIPSGKGCLLIIMHIRSDKGFDNGGLLTFKSKVSKDYYDNMTVDVFEEYFQQMIQLLPNNSTIVMDNASYHSRQLEKLP